MRDFLHRQLAVYKFIKDLHVDPDTLSRFRKSTTINFSLYFASSCPQLNYISTYSLILFFFFLNIPTWIFHCCCFSSFFSFYILRIFFLYILILFCHYFSVLLLLISLSMLSFVFISNLETNHLFLFLSLFSIILSFSFSAFCSHSFFLTLFDFN